MSTPHANGPSPGSNGSVSVTIDELRQQLLGLGLTHAAEVLAEELSEAVKQDRSGAVVLERLLIDPSHYDGPGDDRVAPPVPLGRMGRKLQEILEMPVEQRPLDLYAALAEVAR